MRVAIVHYWLLNMRGGEKVLESLLRLLPEADLFTLFYSPERVSDAIRGRNIKASFLNPLRRGYRALLPLMPLALESFDLRGYDLVISSESGPAKGVLAPSSARHICYCHTPMRYLWDLYPAYARGWRGPLMAPVANYMRLWDYAASARVDEFLANSHNVARRIRRAYNRDSRVIYPPVQVSSFHWQPPEDYYLIVAELVRYKRIDIAVRLFSTTGRRLYIAGDGPEAASLRRIAGPNVRFLGRVPDETLRDLYARCRAFLMPGEEDFGITAVEALASGKAVIALGRGGVLESVPPEAGFFHEEGGLLEAIERFEHAEWTIDPGRLQAHAMRFSEQVFLEHMNDVIATRKISPPFTFAKRSAS